MLYKLMQFDEKMLQIFSFTPSELSEFYSIPIDKAAVIQQNIKNHSIKHVVERDRKICRIMKIYDQDYPHLFKNIHNAPFVIYAISVVYLCMLNLFFIVFL